MSATPMPSTETSFSGHVYLSQEDVTRLLTETSPEARIDVMQRVAANHAEGKLDSKEMAVAEQIFRLLVNDTEAYVRAALADKIKDNPYIPRDIVFALAKDVEEVALPVLRISEVLTDTDLMELIKSSPEINRLVAIAERQRVSSRVSGALIDTGYEKVVARLLDNQGAQISDSSYQKILKDFEQNQDITASLARRSGLPLTVVEKLVNIVSDTLVEQLKQKYQWGAALTQESDQLREATVLKLLDSGVGESDTLSLVDQLHAAARLSPSLIVTALCRGHFHFFESSLAKMASIPVSNAHALVNDRGTLGFKALYTKAGLPDKLFSATRLALTAVQEMLDIGEPPGTLRYANRVAQKILHYAEGKHIENLSYILALIRQNVQR